MVDLAPEAPVALGASPAMRTVWRMPALVVALVLGAVYLVAAPSTADLAAQTYRAALFGHMGFTVWDNAWYGGHHLPGYSVMFPPLGDWIGVRATGVLALLAGTTAFALLVRDRPGGRAAAAWFAVALGAATFNGRMPFVLGTACAMWAALAAERGRRPAAALLGVATALASPVAALFLALATVARMWPWQPSGLRDHRRAAWAAGGVAAVVVTAFLVIAFPEGGSEPFVASAFWPALLAAVAALLLVPSGPVRTAAALYALLLVGAFAVPSPIGGNAARLGALLGGPLAILLLWPARRRWLAVAVLPFAWWAVYPAARDWIEPVGDPSTHEAYYEPVLAALTARAGPADRVEIPFTAGHWEANYVATKIPIARGWERQVDRKDNAALYAPGLTSARYERWLRTNAIRFVALPDAKLDTSAYAEARVIRSGPSYLDEVWHSAHWRLYAVRDAQPMGATSAGTDRFTTARAGVVRIRFTPYWAIVRGTGCVERAPGGWTRVTATGRASVGIRFSLERVVAHGPRCAS